MKANMAPGFFLLIALVAGCAHQSPVGPDQARVLLQERDVSYSQHSFLAAADGDLETVRLLSKRAWMSMPKAPTATATRL